MKIAINIIRILVGLLFIFSGLVKANDPLGTAYKMEEYFEVWNADLTASTFFANPSLIDFATIRAEVPFSYSLTAPSGNVIFIISL